MQDTVHHKMGHILDLSHTGDEDSFGYAGEKPSLATCPPHYAYSGYVFGQDDSSALQYHVGAGGHLSANKSMEEAGYPKYWDLTGGQMSIIAGGAHQGDQYLRWTPTSTGQYVYQTTNLARRPTDPDAWDIRKRVYSTVTNGGSFSPVGLDTLSVRGKL